MMSRRLTFVAMAVALVYFSVIIWIDFECGGVLMGDHIASEGAHCVEPASHEQPHLPKKVLYLLSLLCVACGALLSVFRVHVLFNTFVGSHYGGGEWSLEYRRFFFNYIKRLLRRGIIISQTYEAVAL